ncbi:FT-interacting protein 1 [Dichanthelium oligosanthes]|uniref:FT-interacting protein 1 n=1 Tax=Dichanthelium oligosanthes TaxID=888268 RepID=A0A1E5USB7_9POAL|nr:FT-interacting protein 1 [Dichanthelium oligosanthes]
MAYPYVFRAQAPPVRVKDHKPAKDAAPVPLPQAREQWPAGASRSAGAGAGWLGGLGSGERLASAYDLVETMHYLYVRVVKARGLPASGGGCSPYVEVCVGNYRGATRHFEGKADPEWNQVFAFSRDRVQATALEVVVRDRDHLARDGCVGRVTFDVAEAPVRVPPDSPLAPQWYRLEGAGGRMAASGEVMLAVWAGTQADEAFADACHADAATVRGGDGAAAVQSTRSKVYVTPKLWYLRISVLEAQEVVPPGAGGIIADKGQHADVFAKVQVGGMVLRTRPCATRSATSLAWNEELVFAIAEPFEDPAVLIIEARVHHGKDEIIGRAVLPLTLFEKRLDRRQVEAQWFSLEPFGRPVRPPEAVFAGRVHLRACLEGAYHVMEEPTMYASDTRPTARQLWRPPIGVLEVGVLGAQGLTPMKTVDGRGMTDAYCVAKYGQKWVRTRTVVDSCSPRWNEQYTWEVYDPCTVLTLAVFDNCLLGSATAGSGGNGAAARDQRIGKVRIRLSTLEMDKVYTSAHPLVVLHPSGLRKNGELCLAVRLTCLSLGSVVYLYGQPLLPKMHYIHPLTVVQVDNLRRQAMGIVAARLSRAEPSLRREVVEYMLDADSHVWSIRRSKANFFRVTALLSGAASTARWLADVCRWRNPATTVLVHALFVTLAWFPELILPTVFLYMSAAGLWSYRRRPRRPPHMDARLSCAEAVHPDELDEELDTFPTSRPNAVVRVRYDRLRSVAGRIQTVVGDVATQGERVRSLLAWRDPRATALFTAFCLAAAVVFYVTPVRVVALVVGLYVLRHPRFRSRMPSAAGNFFKRLPSRADTML